MQAQQYTNDEILSNIELTRQEMISVGKKHGYTSPITLKVSEKLDNLLNFYQKYLSVKHS